LLDWRTVPHGKQQDVCELETGAFRAQLCGYTCAHASSSSISLELVQNAAAANPSLSRRSLEHAAGGGLQDHRYADIIDAVH